LATNGGLFGPQLPVSRALCTAFRRHCFTAEIVVQR
jgi:hypothetical protein